MHFCGISFSADERAFIVGSQDCGSFLPAELDINSYRNVCLVLHTGEQLKQAVLVGESPPLFGDSVHVTASDSYAST